jgi:hypothetical protein
MDTTLLALPENDDMQEVYKNELKTFHKNEFILKCLKKFNPKGSKNLEKSLIHLRINDCLEFKNQEDCKLLGLDLSWKNIELSYSEKKQLRNFIESEIIESQKVIRKFNSEDTSGKLKESREKLLELEAKRRESSEKLLELRKKKEELMKNCAEFRLGDFQKNELQILLEKSEINEIKAK